CEPGDQGRRPRWRDNGRRGNGRTGATAQGHDLCPAAAGGRLRGGGWTFATLRRGDGFGLGLRTERGILDVIAAEQDFREGAPTSIDAVFKGQGDISGLKRLAAKAGASASAQRYFVAADQAAFGPCVTNPEKIV